MTPEIIDTPEGPPDLPRIGTRQSNTLHALAQVTHSLLHCKYPRPFEPQSCGKDNLDSGCGNESPTTSAAAKMKFTIPFPNDNNTTIEMDDCIVSNGEVSTTKKQPRRSAKKRVVYFDKSDSDLECDEDGNEAPKKRSFKMKSNATNNDEFKLGPDTASALTHLLGTSESA